MKPLMCNVLFLFGCACTFNTEILAPLTVLKTAYFTTFRSFFD